MQDETQRPEQPPSSTTEPAPAANVTPPPDAPSQPRPAPTPPGPAAPPGPPPRFLENLRAAEVAQPAQPEFTPDHLETVFMPLALTVGSGFKFGCGFLLAVAFASLALFLLFSVIFFVASLMGLPLPIGAT